MIDGNVDPDLSLNLIPEVVKGKMIGEDRRQSEIFQHAPVHRAELPLAIHLQSNVEARTPVSRLRENVMKGC